MLFNIFAMKNRPLVSILINNYNYGRFLRAAIDSALNQTYPHTEIIVVDDGSTDNSREIISSYKSHIIPVMKENGGQASAFNAGFSKSQGNIICFLDSDDVFVNNKVEEVVNAFESAPDIGWCFHPLRLVDTNTGLLVGSTIAFPVLDRNISSRCDFRSQMKNGRLPFYAPSTSGLSFKQTLLKQFLPIPETLPGFCADRYLSNVANALSPGFFLDKKLTLQGIHSNNSCTLREEQQQIQATIAMVTAYCMRVNFPYLARFTNRMFARGLSHCWKAGGVETKYNEVIKNYLSMVPLLEKLEIGMIAVYQSRPWKAVKLYTMLQVE